MQSDLRLLQFLIDRNAQVRDEAMPRGTLGGTRESERTELGALSLKRGDRGSGIHPAGVGSEERIVMTMDGAKCKKGMELVVNNESN